VRFRSHRCELLICGAYVGLEAQDHHGHKRFPERLAFTLNNRVRRSLEPPDRLISKLCLRAGDVVVDFGCGTGFYTIPIAKVVARTIAVDISPRMLERTDSHARKSGVTVELLRSDGVEIKLGDESVDLIFLNHVFHEVVDKQRVLNEFLRILKPSGRLAIVEKTRGGLFSGKLGPPIIDQTEVIQDLERAGFSLDETISYGNDSTIVGKKL
jgi:ubiquinone/menaquinone biosynthesis C-methylase UbiE